MPSPVVSVRALTGSYGGSPALQDVSLCIDEGQMVGLVGPSGAGKTSLLRALLGQLPVTRGEVHVMGKLVRHDSPADIGYVPQLETINWNFPVTVEEVVLMGRAACSGPWPWPSRAERRAVNDILDRLGLLPFARRHIRDLSGGQQQRAFLARA